MSLCLKFERASCLNKIYLLYSSLPDTATGSGGKYPEVSHFISKNHVEQYIRTVEIPNTTFVYPGFYFQNFERYVHLKENGEIEVAIPYLEGNDALPMIDIEDDIGVRVFTYIFFFVNK